MPFLRRDVFYGFAEADANYGDLYDPDYRSGGGATVGWLSEPAPRWKLHGFASYLSYPLGDRSHEFSASLQQRYTIQKDVAFRLELSHRDKQNEGVVRLDFYL
jgi:hypothetical protein